MSYDTVKHLKPSEFKRLCGVRPETFEAMMSVLRPAEADKPIGRPSKLTLRRSIVDDIGVLEGVPDIFSDWAIVGSE
jgi:hypothetical protein